MFVIYGGTLAKLAAVIVKLIWMASTPQVIEGEEIEGEALDCKRLRTMTASGKEYRIAFLKKEFASQRRAISKDINKAEIALADSTEASILQRQRARIEINTENLAQALGELESLVDKVSETYNDIVEFQADLLQIQGETKRLVERIENKELESCKTQTADEVISSVCSKKSRSIGSRSSHSRTKSNKTTSSRETQIAVKAARLKAELEFIELESQKEVELKRFRIAKELAVTEAEIAARNSNRESLLDCNSVKDKRAASESSKRLPEEDASEELLHNYLRSQVNSLASYDFDKNVSEEIVHETDLKENRAEYSSQENFSHMSNNKASTKLPNTATNDRRNRVNENPTRSLSYPLDPLTPSFVSKLDPSPLPPLQFPYQHSSNVPNYHHNNPFVNKATEPNNAPSHDTLQRLADLIVQQKNNKTLPVPEPEIFKGDPIQYPIWLQSFEAIVESNVTDSSQKLYYLGRYTDGEAKESIKGLLSLRTEDAYTRAKKLLTSRYGNPFTIADAYRKRASDWPNIPPNDGVSLRKYSDFLSHCLTAMDTIKYLNIFNDPNENQKLARKLPKYLFNSWNREVDHWLNNDWNCEAATGYPPFSHFCTFLSKEARIACNPVLSVKSMERSKDPRRLWRKDGRTGNELGSFATGTEERKYDDEVAIRQKPCMKCKKQHNLNDCQDFLKLTLEQRKEFVQSKGLCFGCLTWGHVNKNCRRKSVCKICGKFHPTSLHDVAYKVTSKVGKKDEESSKDEEGQRKASSYRVNLRNDIYQITCPSHSLIVPVWLHHRKNPGRRLLVYALLDEQSDACFIKVGTLRKLGIEGPKVQLYLSTVLAEETVESEKIGGLIIQGVKEEEMIQLPTTYSRDAIPAKRSQIPRPETAMKWNHLQRIAKDLTPYYPEAEVCLLIGINCIRAIKPRDIIPGCDDEPYAQKTALGWGIIGIVDPKVKVENDNASDVLCNRVSCREVQTGSDKVCHFVAPMQVKEVFSPSQVKKMFELDFSERDNREKYLSTEDMLFMDKVTKGIHQLSNGHYEIPLPFKTNIVALPNNKEMALRRLEKLKRRLKNDPQYRKDYLKFMDDLMDNEHAERVPLNELTRSNDDVWYLPHHGVYHPKKPGKIRVVFDCSATFGGESLNQNLLSGPDLTNSLVGVLCRFRQNSTAFSCDIEAMFHQVLVNREHRNYLNFFGGKTVCSIVIQLNFG